ncbi:ubiquitin elongating factor core-domain-containing protein [Blastocladiella britannica]|nr:ubiquitin elongating factor core-domain-containing protein [Blastocladiella britannica]
MDVDPPTTSASGSSSSLPGSAAKPIQEWQSIALTKVFQVSLDPADPRAIPELSQEIASERGNPELHFHSTTGVPLFTPSLLERVLVTYLSLPAHANGTTGTIHYLLGARDRCAEISNNLQAKYRAADLPQRLATVEEARALIVNYIGIALMMPDMFPQPDHCIAAAASEIMDGIIKGSVSYLVLNELVARYADDYSCDQILYPILQSLSVAMRSRKLDQNPGELLLVLGNLLELQRVPALIANLPNFMPAPGALPKVAEVETFLGPFFHVSGFGFDDMGVITSYFGDAMDRSPTDLGSGVRSLRLAVQHYIGSLHMLFGKIVRSSPVLRERTLAWIGAMLKLNERRNGTYIQPDSSGTFGFVHNITVALLRACDPVMLPPFLKVGLIDKDYFKNPKAKYDVSGLTKMNADEIHTARYFALPAGTDPASVAPPNFISDCVYLALGWMHTGMVRNVTYHKQYSKALKERQEELAAAQADLENHRGKRTQAMAEAGVVNLKRQVNAMIGARYSMEAHLQDPELIETSMRFFSLSATWQLRILTSDNGIQSPYRQPLHLPLAHESPAFQHLPEHFIEDIIDYLIYVLRFDRLLFDASQVDVVIELYLVILMNPEFAKNPYLKSKLAEVFFFMSYHEQLMIPLSNHPASMVYLVPSLMRLYVDVEITGAHSQFYDKFNIRYNIQHLLKSIWEFPVHRNRVREVSSEAVFVRFVNLMMSDIRYLLDEGLSKLTEIYAIQAEMASPEWASTADQRRKEREDALEMAERQATSYMQLAEQTLETFGYVSKEIPHPFLTAEIIDRLAAMLDYNLSYLVGPKCADLKVKDKEKYHFRPTKLLSSLVEVYLHLAPFEDFARAVARDERSYRKEWFQKAAGVMQVTGLRSSAEIDELAAFVGRVESAILAEAQEEEDLGEIPDDFMDPLMCVLMEDPVTLPTSGVTVDRSTIVTHLLGEKRDPFNREELKIEDVIPNTDLKAQIEAFKANARRAR